MHGDRCNPFLRPCPPFAVPPSARNLPPLSRLRGQAGRSALPSCLLTSEGSDVTMKWGGGGGAGALIRLRRNFMLPVFPTWPRRSAGRYSNWSFIALNHGAAFLTAL